MRSRSAVALAGVLLGGLSAGCGPGPWEGSYEGPVHGVLTCGDSVAAGDVPATVTIAQLPNSSAIAGFGFGCDFWGTLHGSTVTISTGSCDPGYNGVDGAPPAIQQPVALTSGKVTLSGSTLTLSLDGNELDDSGASNGCAVQMTGTATKQSSQ